MSKKPPFINRYIRTDIPYAANRKFEILVLLDFTPFLTHSITKRRSSLNFGLTETVGENSIIGTDVPILGVQWSEAKYLLVRSRATATQNPKFVLFPTGL